MSYIALARKWRPRTFSELVGQNHLTKALINSLNQQRLHHAYLFTGTRGVGKTSVARLLAKALNCEQGISSEPCLTCDTCVAIEQGRFIDLLEIDGASKTRVEDTRDILENVQYAPTNGRFKIYLIDEVHMLSNHSFNALLKTLEEPPPHVKFLLATTDPQKLPVTVLSRCLQFNLKHLTTLAISQHLQLILDKEQFPYEPVALTLLATAARGSMRDALSLLDQAIASCDGTISTLDVKNSLGFTQQDYALQLLTALAEQNPHQLMIICRHIAEESGHFGYVLSELLNHLHHMAIIQNLPNANQIIEENIEITALSNKFSAEDTQLFYQIVLKSTEEMALAPTMAIGFEMTMLRMYTFRPASKQTTPELAYLSSSEHTRLTFVNTQHHIPIVPAPIEAHDKIDALITPEQNNHLFKNIDQDDYLQDDGPTTSEPSIIYMTKNNLRPTEAISNKAAPMVTLLDKKDDLLWNDLVPQLKLSGLALSAAENAELSSKDEGDVVLRVSSAHRSVFTPAVLKRIEEALGHYYKESIRVTLKSDEPVLSSPAQQRQINQNKQHQNAEAALLSDPFFQQLQEEFSAQLLENSISSLKDSL